MILLFNGDYTHPEAIAATDEAITTLFASQADQRSGYDYLSEGVNGKVKSVSGKISRKVSDMFKSSDQSNDQSNQNSK